MKVQRLQTEVLAWASRPFAPGHVALALLAWALPSAAQQSGPARAWVVTPTFTASETYTDVQRNTGFSGGEFVTQVSPGIQMSSRSGRVQGSLSYALTASHHSRNSQGDVYQNALSSQVAVEAVEKWMYVDARASISQQSISAYGEQTVFDPSRSSANQTEVATLSVSPYVRGTLAGLANYELRLNASANNARNSVVSDSTTTGASVSLSSPRQGAVLGWGLSATHQKVDFRAGRATESDRVSLTLTARPYPDLQLGLSGGMEATNVGSTGRQSYDNWGGSLRWTPTERTAIGLQADRRYFGNAHSISFEHRMRRMAWRFSDSRSATGGGDPNGVGQPISLFDLYFLLFASQQPDPALRELMVLDYLRLIGRSPNEMVGRGLLNSAVSLQRRQDLSLAILGVRSTINLQAFTTQTRSLDNLIAVPAVESVTQRGATATLSYRLTPLSSVSLNGAWQRTLDTPTRAGNDLKSLLLGWTGQLSRTATGSLNVRHSRFHSSTAPYDQTSVSAAISLRF